MRKTISSLILASGLIAIGLVQGAIAQERADLPARERIDRSFTLRPGAAVSISSIAGPVTVETGGGSRAEVHILRQARTRQELECTRTEVEGRNGGLSIRQLTPSRLQSCRTIEMRQTVRLVLPRNVDLSLESIAGKLEVGTIDGALRLNSIAGRTTIAGARSANISSVAGRLQLGLGPIDRQGVRISSVTGSVELLFRRGTNADFHADSVLGRVTSASPAVQVRREQNSYRARVGTGGPMVSVSSIVGQVRLGIV